MDSNKEVILSTGDIRKDYEVVKIITAYGTGVRFK